MASSKIYWAKEGGVVHLKLVGRILYPISSSFDSFLQNLFETKDFKHIIVDLTESETIDSINLGLLAKIAKFMQSEFGSKATVVSTNEDINVILQGVGFDQVFNILDTSDLERGRFEEIPELEGAADENIANMVLSAHRSLIDVNEANRPIYEDICTALEEEVKRQEEG